MLNRCNQCIIEPIGILVINSHSILTLLESRKSKGIGFLKLIFFGDIAKEWMDIPPLHVLFCVCLCTCAWMFVRVYGHMLALEVREQLRSLFSYHVRN